MSVVRLRPVLLHSPRDRDRRFSPSRWGVFSRRTVLGGFRAGVRWGKGDRRWNGVVRSKSVDSVVEKKGEGVDVVFEETFRLDRNETVEGKVSVRLDWGKEGGPKGNVVIGCDMEGKWVLHWGVTYCDDIGSEWDQPPVEMRPPGSVPVKDYAIETPLTKSSSASQGQILHEVKIDVDCSTSVAAIHFVLKDEETGSWFQCRGRDFRIPLLCSAEEDDVTASGQKTFNIWPGAFSQISGLLLKSEESQENENTQEDALEFKEIKQNTRPVEGYSKEYSILKEKPVENSLTVAVKKDGGTNKNYLHLETDLPGKVIVHWGVNRDGSGTWQLPAAPHPPQSRLFRNKAVQTLLQQKVDGEGNWGSFPLDGGISGVFFVLKLNQYTWIRNMGGDFVIPLKSETSEACKDQIEVLQVGLETAQPTEATEKSMLDASTSDSQEGDDEIITDIRNLVTDISSEKSKSTKSKEAQENILQEIEKLAAEAYGIFRSTVPFFIEEAEPEESTTLPLTISSGTGTGYEILCQGFNWESHKSGKWYIEISEKATELAKFGFTTIWLPPPTDSVSPEGYMPKDLYNLNSRYGTMEELKEVVEKLHEVNIKVLGDVVLNHRCAHSKNQNGVWNVFGGRLNWDDRAIVADDPHFQGKGNKSSGDNFHAAPNIDHSQEFVRNDIKEWLCWLRKEIGYDGWRLDFVRGFWGGYVKDYLEASGPYFVVGEYWDSLSYTYGQMDHNQDAHRQRIIDWINATNGTAGAFDVTTKGILHTVLEKCEYWRLSDEKGKPPGVVGWWPSRAVTFIENHDTGSTQGHWRFPEGKEMQGYAYILTHPGTPAVFYDHIYSHYQGEICNLISLRNRMKLNCRSTIKIVKAERDVYAALMDDKVAMKIGPGYYEPPNDLGNWSVGAEGRDYKVWELSR